MTSPTSPTISASGITAPNYATILAYLIAQCQGIYGSDVYLENDSQDGQFLGIIAAAINDANTTAVAVYNAFSPQTAQGNGLSQVVAINGLQRNLATFSAVQVTLTGTPGTVITNGLVNDTSGNTWSLPAVVTIPGAGYVTVQATCQTPGNVVAAVGAVSSIATPTLGWVSVTNSVQAIPGIPQETDAALRLRQVTSTEIPAFSFLAGILGAVLALPGITFASIYENATGTTDVNSQAPHSIQLVAAGGTPSQIALTLYEKKAPGVLTVGNTALTVVDPLTGISNMVSYSIPTGVTYYVGVSVYPLAGYSTIIQAEIQAAVAAYISTLGIGSVISVLRIAVAAALGVTGDGLTYILKGITLGPSASPTGTADIPLTITQYPICAAANVAVTTSGTI